MPGGAGAGSLRAGGPNAIGGNPKATLGQSPSMGGSLNDRATNRQSGYGPQGTSPSNASLGYGVV